MTQTKNNLFQNIIIALLLLLLGGCAGKTLAPSDRQQINSINIDSSNVTMEEGKNAIMLNTSASAWSGALGGLVGALAYEKFHDKTPEETIVFLFHKENMLKNTVRDSFRYQFEHANVFPVSSENKADTDLIINVKQIQFHELNGNNLRLTGVINGKLVSSTGKNILWEKNEFFSGFNSQLIEYPLDLYISDPSKLEYALSVFSQMIAGEFVKNLGGTPIPVNHELYKESSTAISRSTDSREQNLDSTEIKSLNSTGENIDLESKLKSLKEMYEKGLIDKDEYDKKRSELLSQL